jgi:hypothetical protein
MHTPTRLHPHLFIFFTMSLMDVDGPYTLSDSDLESLSSTDSSVRDLSGSTSAYNPFLSSGQNTELMRATHSDLMAARNSAYLRVWEKYRQEKIRADTLQYESHLLSRTGNLAHNTIT